MDYENMTDEEIAADTAAKLEYCDPKKNKNWNRALFCVRMLADANIYLACVSLGITLHKVIKG